MGADPQALYHENERVIRSVTRSFCARHGVEGYAATEFESLVNARLSQDGFAVLRKFRGNSSIKTYLTSVVSRLYIDHRRSSDGRWRSSAEAKRQGVTGVLLERLIYRDGYTFQEAKEAIRTRMHPPPTIADLNRIYSALPQRTNPRHTRDVYEVDPPGTDRADATVLGDEAEVQWQSVRDALFQAMRSLEAEDQLILRLRFWERMKVVDIARALQLEQKPLYNRIKALESRLRTMLESQGIGEGAVVELLEEVNV